LTFLDAKEVSQLNESMEQKVAGIGIALKVDEATRGIIVATVLPRSPALKSGVLAGDRIVHVNDIELPTEGTLEKTVKLLRGPAGSPVTVSVKRNGADQLVRIQLVRDVIQLASVKGHRLKTDGNWEFMLDDERKVGYIRLEYLGNQSPEEMRSALNDVKLRGMKALVLDLRNNPGGSLDDAIKVADLFIETGRIVTVKGRSGEKAYDAAQEGTFLGFPIAVLVNRKSASAAEIVAACLQDHGRAVVVGERTVGQGIVRSIMPLKGGLGALKLPVAAYYRPSGKNVNRYPHSTDGEDWGVMPNVGYEISMTDDEMKEFETARFAREAINAQTPELEDRQLQKALEYSARILGQ
jgi:carboxyl-terminal processing protease